MSFASLGLSEALAGAVEAADADDALSAEEADGIPAELFAAEIGWQPALERTDLLADPVAAALRALGFLGWEVEFCVIGPVRFEPPRTKNPASFRRRGGARRS